MLGACARAHGEICPHSVMKATEPTLFLEISCLTGKQTRFQKENPALTLAREMPAPKIPEFCLPKGYEYSLGRKDIYGWARPE